MDTAFFFRTLREIRNRPEALLNRVLCEALFTAGLDRDVHHEIARNGGVKPGAARILEGTLHVGTLE